MFYGKSVSFTLAHLTFIQLQTILTFFCLQILKFSLPRWSKDRKEDIVSPLFSVKLSTNAESAKSVDDGHIHSRAMPYKRIVKRNVRYTGIDQ